MRSRGESVIPTWKIPMYSASLLNSLCRSERNVRGTGENVRTSQCSLGAYPNVLPSFHMDVKPVGVSDSEPEIEGARRDEMLIGTPRRCERIHLRYDYRYMAQALCRGLNVVMFRPGFSVISEDWWQSYLICKVLTTFNVFKFDHHFTS